MKKERFFTIKSKSKYSSPTFYFKDLESAMKTFKFLVEGNAVAIDSESVPPKKSEDVLDDYLHYIKGESDYHLSSEIIDIYTKEEIEKIKKERSKK